LCNFEGYGSDDAAQFSGFVLERQVKNPKNFSPLMNKTISSIDLTARKHFRVAVVT
jgi:hypothetical protein